MALIENSTFPGAPFGQFNGHLQSILPSFLRKITGVNYQRERITTPDDDFLDLDWVKKNNSRLVIISHGLEGNSSRQYILGTAKIFSENGWDVLAWNCRSCSGEMNRQFRMYHHGDVEDIGFVVRHALKTGKYRQISFVGFSMGANITMKYLASLGQNASSEIHSAAVFSAPCDIEAAADVLDLPQNFIYKRKFFKALSQKMKLKNEQYPGRLDMEKLKMVRRWRDFDEWFAAPVCGFRSAAEFYENASAKNFISKIRVPTLLVNAMNDPILMPSCFPIDIARGHRFFHLEMPKGGGHCGFQIAKDEFSWAERRALAFCESEMGRR